MFNGYVEDAGMESARTLHIALALLAGGAGRLGRGVVDRGYREITRRDRAPWPAQRRDRRIGGTSP
jgi:hypothetical protein